MTDSDWDRRLGIRTEGTLELLQKSAHYNRYEATPYAVLDEWFRVRPLRTGDHLVDFGCGKGRVPIYSAYRFGTDVTGIELNGRLLQEAYANLQSFRTIRKKARGRVVFEQAAAETYVIQPEQNVFYFFNPFSVEIFQAVLRQIVQSAERTPRPVDVVLYYPTSAYVDYLEEQTPFERIDEVPIPVPGMDDESERLLIYRLG